MTVIVGLLEARQYFICFCAGFTPLSTKFLHFDLTVSVPFSCIYNEWQLYLARLLLENGRPSSTLQNKHNKSCNSPLITYLKVFSFPLNNVVWNLRAFFQQQATLEWRRMRVIKKTKIVKRSKTFSSHCRMNENYILDLFYLEMTKMDVAHNVETAPHFSFGWFLKYYTASNERALQKSITSFSQLFLHNYLLNSTLHALQARRAICARHSILVQSRLPGK